MMLNIRRLRGIWRERSPKSAPHITAEQIAALCELGHRLQPADERLKLIDLSMDTAEELAALIKVDRDAAIWKLAGFVGGLIGNTIDLEKESRLFAACIGIMISRALTAQEPDEAS